VAHRRVGRAVPCPPRLPTRVTLAPGRRARSVAPYLTAIQRGRWPVLGSINPDSGILHPPECIRSALATEAGQIIKRSACAKNPQVGRAVPCPPRLPTHVTLGPGRRARSDAPYLTAIQRGRWPVLGLVNPDPGIFRPPECIRSALATEAGQIIKRSACAKKSAGRAGSPLPAAIANPRHLMPGAARTECRALPVPKLLGTAISGRGPGARKQKTRGAGRGL